MQTGPTIVLLSGGVEDMRQVVVDVETTGLKPQEGHRVVEFAALELVDLEPGEEYQTYINPKREVPEEATKVHGLTYEFLKDYPSFLDVLDEIVEFVGDSELIAHNAPFDRGFLISEGLDLRQSWIDTYQLAQDWGYGKKANLDRMAKNLSITKTRRKIHGALKDCILLADVYVSMMDARARRFREELLREAIKEKYRPLMPIRAHQPTEEERIRHKEFMEKYVVGGMW